MSHQGVLSAKQQEAAFTKILKKIYNQRCADCTSKSPTWASLDFGVFVCYNCSGLHRMLGMNVTRIRSTKLDCWTQENVDMMDTLGNDLNDYWENRMPKNAKIQPSASPDEIKVFIQEKYVKRSWVKQGQADPKTRYTQCLTNGIPFKVNQTNTFFSENGQSNQPFNNLKQFNSNNQPIKQSQWGFERKERQMSVDVKQKDVNLLSPNKEKEDNWGQFAPTYFNSVSGVPNQYDHVQHPSHSLQKPSNGTSPSFKPKPHNVGEFDFLTFQNHQQNPQDQQSQQNQYQQFNSYNPKTQNQTININTSQFQSFTPNNQSTQNNIQQNPNSWLTDFSFEPQKQQSQQPQQQSQNINQFQSQQQTQTQQYQQQQQQQQYQNHQYPQQQQQQSQPQNQKNDFSSFSFPIQGNPQAQNNGSWIQSQPQQQQQQQQQSQQQYQTFSKPPLPQKANSSNQLFQTTSIQNNQEKYQNNPFAKDIMNLYAQAQPTNKYEQFRNNPFM